MGPLVWNRNLVAAMVACIILAALDGYPHAKAASAAPWIEIRVSDTAHIELNCMDTALRNTTPLWYTRSADGGLWKKFEKRAKFIAPAKNQDYQCCRLNSTPIAEVFVRVDPGSGSISVGWICAVVFLTLGCVALTFVLVWKYVPRWWIKRSVLVEEDSGSKINGDAEVINVSTSAKECDAGYVIPIADPGRRGTDSEYMEIEDGRRDRLSSNSHYEDPKRRSETASSPVYENVASLQRNHR